MYQACCKVWGPAVSISLALLCLAPAWAHAASPDQLYRQGKYKEAQALYEQMDMDHPRESTYRFNRGCASYQLKDYKAAQAAFTSVYHRAGDDSLRFKAAFNLANSTFQGGDYSGAATLYKEALRLNPLNNKARFNLELALKKIEEAKKQKSDKKDQPDQKQDQDKQSQQQQQQQKDSAGNKDQKSNKDQQQNQQQGQDQQQKSGEAQKTPPQDSGKRDQGQQPQPQNGQNPQTKPEDLKGELKAANPATQAQAPKEGQEAQQAQILERKKADAMIDNVPEDRSRYIQLQVPPELRRGVKSGKYW